MIFTERTITIIDHRSEIDSPVVLYRGDKNVELHLTIKESKFKYRDEDNVNVIESTQASYGQLIIKTPNEKDPIFSEITPTRKGAITFLITGEMIDEVTEVGLYDFQVRLLDKNKQSRATIPPIINGIEIREPITAEDSNVLNSATVGMASTGSEQALDTFGNDGNYIINDWKFGDRITDAKLNKMDDGIYESYKLGMHNSLQIHEIAKKGTTTEVIREVATNEINNQLNNGGIINQFTQMLENDGVLLNLGTWQLIALNHDGTAQVADNSKLSMFDKMPIISGTKFKFKITPGYKYKLFYWDENNNIINTSRLWLEEDITQIINASYLRIAISKKDGSQLTLEDASKLTVYTSEVKEKYQDYSITLNNFDIDSSLGGTIANTDAMQLLTNFIDISLGKFIIYNSLIPFKSYLSFILYMYDEYHNYLGHKPFILDTFDLIDLNDLVDENCKRVAINYRCAVSTLDKDSMLNNIKVKYIKTKNDDLNPSLMTYKQLDKEDVRVGIVSITGEYFDSLKYSICTKQELQMKAGNKIKLSNYDSYILTIRIMDNGKVMESIEIKEGSYTFTKDCNVYINIVRYNKETNSSYSNANLTTFEENVVKLLLIDTHECGSLGTTSTPTSIPIAVEKARQIASLSWTPLKDIPRHGGVFEAGTTYKGVPYSSARKTDTFIGSNVSFNTFLSALKNPNSVIYTENLSDAPYNQPNAYTYFGMVCSTFVGYCLGMYLRPTSVNWNCVDGMRRIKTNIDLIEPGDSLLYQDPVGTDGHVMIIGEVTKDSAGNVVNVEVLESWPPTINRTYYSRANFINIVLNRYQIYRYSKLNEVQRESFDFNFIAEQYLNIDYGNYSNYKVGKNVKVTTFKSEYSHILVYTNNTLIKSVPINTETNITELNDLAEGDYRICLSKSITALDISPYIYFKVVDDTTTVTVSSDGIKITFGSYIGNANWFSWNDDTHVVMKCRDITGDEKANGFLFDTFKSGNWKIKVYYENDYGVFSSEAIDVTIP